MSPEPVNRWHARRVTRTLWLVLLVSCLEALAAEAAQRWVWRGDGVSLTLEALPARSVAAFYAARGFPEAVARDIASACVLQTELVHGAQSGKLRTDLSQWRIRPQGGRPQGLSPKTRWMAKFEAEEVPPAALVAFRWSTFPWRVELAPGEQMRGMILYGLAPGLRFDVEAPLELGGELLRARFTGVRCPDDEKPTKSEEE